MTLPIWRIRWADGRIQRLAAPSKDAAIFRAMQLYRGEIKDVRRV